MRGWVRHVYFVIDFATKSLKKNLKKKLAVTRRKNINVNDWYPGENHAIQWYAKDTTQPKPLPQSCPPHRPSLFHKTTFPMFQRSWPPMFKQNFARQSMKRKKKSKNVLVQRWWQTSSKEGRIRWAPSLAVNDLWNQRLFCSWPWYLKDKKGAKSVLLLWCLLKKVDP